MDFLFTFLEGFASFISPCVLPLLPIYISYFAGSENKRNRALVNSISFVIGFSAIFIFLAIIANSLGSIIIGTIKYVKIIFGILIILLGLNYMGFLKFDLFSKFKKFNIDVKNFTFFRAFLFGMLFSISMTPCVGTFLTSAILLVATEESLVRGILLIVVYCLGLGIPFIISSLLIDRLKNVFSFIKKNYKIVKIISGMILVIMGVYLIFF